MEWQLHNIQANVNDKTMKRDFGVQYYDLQKNDVRRQASFCRLVVFTWEASENLHDNISEPCMKNIVPVVKGGNLPFILCLKNTYTGDMENNVVLLNEAMKTLRDGLGTTHLIVMTDPPPSKLCSLAKFE